MSGRDSGRGGRGGFGDRNDRRPSFGDRDRPAGGGFRDRDGAPGGPPRDRGARTFGPPPSRPWERRDDERPARPAGDRPFDRAARPAGDRPFERPAERPMERPVERPTPPAPEREVRVERYYDEPGRPRREERAPDDRPRRFGDDRPTRDFSAPSPSPRPAPPVAPPAPVPAAAPTPAPALGRVEDMIAVFHAGPRIWTPHHLIESWHDEERLRAWQPTDKELHDMVEDNIEADRLVPGRDRRSITIEIKRGIVTLTGTVRNRMVKFAAGSDAYWTYGVEDVRNDLVIKGRAAANVTASAEPAAPVVVAAVAAPVASVAPTELTVAPKRAARRKPATEVVAEPVESEEPTEVTESVEAEELVETEE